MTMYELVAHESKSGRCWYLFENVAGEGWEDIASIGGLPTADAKDWASAQISHEDGIEWFSADGTVFSDRWTTTTNDPWFDEE